MKTVLVKCPYCGLKQKSTSRSFGTFQALLSATLWRAGATVFSSPTCP